MATIDGNNWRQVLEPIADRVGQMLERCRREHGISDESPPEKDATPALEPAE